jgi:hypothetical protein
MSPAQRIMLFGMWNRAAKNNGWNTTARSEFTRSVLGKIVSWNELSNAEIDRLKTALQLAAEPDDLGARLEEQSDGEEGALRRAEWLHERLVSALGAVLGMPDSGRVYAGKILRSKFDLGRVDALSLAEREQYNLTLRNRLHALISRCKKGEQKNAAALDLTRPIRALADGLIHDAKINAEEPF